MTTNEPDDITAGTTPDATPDTTPVADAATAAEIPVVPDDAATRPAATGPAEDPTTRPAARTVDLRRPAWLTRTVVLAGGAAAATFVIGGAAGFAIGASSGDHDGTVRLTRDGGPRFEDGGPRFGGPGLGPGGPQGRSQLPQG